MFIYKNTTFFFILLSLITFSDTFYFFTTIEFEIIKTYLAILIFIILLASKISLIKFDYKKITKNNLVISYLSLIMSLSNDLFVNLHVFLRYRITVDRVLFWIGCVFILCFGCVKILMGMYLRVLSYVYYINFNQEFLRKWRNGNNNRNVISSI